MTAESKEEIVDKLVSFLAITVLFLIIWQLVGPRLVGTEPVTLNADIDASITKGWSDEIIEFDASGSEGAFVTYEWDFGDGNTAVGEKVQHNWSQGGLYFVVLTAKDAEDRQSVAFQEIRINHKENGEGEVDGGDEEIISSTINPYVKNIHFYINLTGQNGLVGIESDITLTITSPSGVIFEESYSLANNEQLFVEEEVIEGDMVGDWEIILESNDPVSDFAYNYNWETYFQDSA